MPNALLYWEGIIAAEDVIELYASSFQKLLDGSYKSSNLDLKKLKGHRMYSIRVNDADRLLFTIIIGPDNRPYLLFLEVIPEHDYQKSRFLKPGVLKAFLEKNGAVLKEQRPIRAEDFVADVGDDLAALREGYDENVPLQRKAMSYYQNFIQFNDEQQQAHEASLPLILLGIAGSGKTVVALTALANAVKACEMVGTPARLLYVAQSAALVSMVRSLWNDHPANTQDVAVEIKTYEELFNSLAGEQNTQKKVGKKEFGDWLKSYAAHIRQIKKNAKGKQVRPAHSTDSDEKLFDNLDLVYQEFRIIAAYEEQSYLQLGKRQSLFAEVSQKEQLFAAFKTYIKHLEQQTFIDLSLMPLPDSEQKYRKIFIDEAQDESFAQLKELYALAEDGNVVFCMDNNQSLFDIQSKRLFLQGLDPARKMSLVVLSASYRCPPEIAKITARLMEAKLRVTGGVLDAGEASSIQSATPDKKGEVQWINSLTEDIRRQIASSSDYAVIISALSAAYKENPTAYKDYINGLYGTPMIFTPEEIKGLEFKHVLVHQPFSESVFQDANKILAAEGEASSSKSVVHRAKNQDNKQFGPYFNQVFTAFTRATDSLVIFQEEGHHLKYLIKELKKGLPEAETARQEIKVSDTADWLAEAKRIALNGNWEQAQGILTTKLGKTAEDFERLSLIWRKSVVLTAATPAVQTTKVAPEASVVQSTKAPKAAPVIQVMRPSLSVPSELRQVRSLANRATTNIEDSISTSSSRKKMVQYLRNNWKIITLDYLYSPINKRNISRFYILTFELEGVNALLFLLSKRPKLFTNMAANTLILPEPEHNPFYGLVRLYEGRRFLYELFTINPEPIKFISRELLCRPYLGLTFLHLLPCLPAVLQQIFTHKPELKKQLSIEDLSYKSDRYEQFLSPLFVLADSEKGVDIIDDLFNSNPDLMSQLRREVFFDAPNNESVFSRLTQRDKGISVLKKIFAANPELRSAVSIMDLTKVEPENHTSAFLNLVLAYERNGSSILNDLFDFNPDLRKKITFEILWGQSCLRQDGANILLWLIFKDAFRLLNSLLDDNPSLVTSLPSGLLNQNWTPLVDANIPSLLHWLVVGGEHATGFLFRLIKENKQLVAHIPLARWKKKFGDNSPLIFFAHDADESVMEQIPLAIREEIYKYRNQHTIDMKHVLSSNAEAFFQPATENIDPQSNSPQNMRDQMNQRNEC